jgi:hypothetical protein
MTTETREEMNTRAQSAAKAKTGAAKLDTDINA